VWCDETIDNRGLDAVTGRDSLDRTESCRAESNELADLAGQQVSDLGNGQRWSMHEVSFETWLAHAPWRRAALDRAGIDGRVVISGIALIVRAGSPQRLA